MKKLFLIICFLLSLQGIAQVRTDYLVFQGKFTTTIRNTLTVPTDGAIWGFNMTTQQFEYALDDQVWHTMEIYTTAEKSKLAGIEPGATADQTGSEIESALDTELGHTRWRQIEVPSGGTSGQVLKKATGTDYDVEWGDDGGGGGSVEDDAYGPGWNGDISNAASQNALWDKIETLLSDITGSVDSDNMANGSLLLEDFNLTGSATDEYVWTYEETTGGVELVAEQALSLGGTGNKDLTIDRGNTIDLTSVDGISPLNLRMHPNSGVVFDQLFAGTLLEITAAGLGANVLTFRTDSPAAMLLTTTQEVTGDKQFTGAMEIPSQTLIQKDPGGNYAILRFKINGVERWLKGDGTSIYYGSSGTEERLLNETDYAALEEQKFILPLGAVGADIAVGTFTNFVPVHDAITITRVEAHLNTAPTGAIAIFDINEDGVSILSTKLSIDGTENYSDDAASQAVISDTAIDAKSVLSVDVDQIGSTVAGANGTITIYYTKP